MSVYKSCVSACTRFTYGRTVSVSLQILCFSLYLVHVQAYCQCQFTNLVFQPVLGSRTGVLSVSVYKSCVSACTRFTYGRTVSVSLQILCFSLHYFHVRAYCQCQFTNPVFQPAIGSRTGVLSVSVYKSCVSACTRFTYGRTVSVSLQILCFSLH